MHGSLLLSARSLLLLVLVFLSIGAASSTDVQTLVYKSARSDFVSGSENNYDLKLDIDKGEYAAISTIQRDETKGLLDDKISEIIVCSQPTISRSFNFQNPLSSRSRSGLTLMIEMQLDKDEILALRSIQTLEKSKLEAVRFRIASTLRNILDIDAEYREGRAPSDSTIDLSIRPSPQRHEPALVPVLAENGSGTEPRGDQAELRSLFSRAPRTMPCSIKELSGPRRNWHCCRGRARASERASVLRSEAGRMSQFTQLQAPRTISCSGPCKRRRIQRRRAFGYDDETKLEQDWLSPRTRHSNPPFSNSAPGLTSLGYYII